MAGAHGRADSESSHAEAPRWLPGAPAIFVLLWSGGFAFVAMGLEDAEPVTFLALRFGLVVAVLLALAVLLRPPMPATRAAWGHLAVMGVVLQALYFGLLYLALVRISAGNAALVVSLQPILVALLSPHLVGEGVGLVRWAGLGLGLLGAALVIVARSGVEATSTVGLLYAAGGLGAITTGTFYEKRFGTEQHPVTANLVQNSVGLAVTLPVAWAFEGLSLAWTGALAGSLAYLVLANSLVSLTLLLAMVRRGEAAKVSALFFLVPPIAALIAWALLGERMPAVAWAGLAMASVGVAVAARAGARGSGPVRGAAIRR